jgi:hypothetical protein
MLACGSNTTLIPASVSSTEGFHNHLLADTIPSSACTLTTEGRTAEEPPFLNSSTRKE